MKKRALAKKTGGLSERPRFYRLCNVPLLFCPPQTRPLAPSLNDGTGWSAKDTLETSDNIIRHVTNLPLHRTLIHRCRKNETVLTVLKDQNLTHSPVHDFYVNNHGCTVSRRTVAVVTVFHRLSDTK